MKWKHNTNVTHVTRSNRVICPLAYRIIFSRENFSFSGRYSLDCRVALLRIRTRVSLLGRLFTRGPDSRGVVKCVGDSSTKRSVCRKLMIFVEIPATSSEDRRPKYNIAYACRSKRAALSTPRRTSKTVYQNFESPRTKNEIYYSRRSTAIRFRPNDFLRT